MESRKKVKRGLLKIAQKIGEKEVVRNITRWPPDCMGVLHQPKRPDGFCGK